MYIFFAVYVLHYKSYEILKRFDALSLCREEWLKLIFNKKLEPTLLDLQWDIITVMQRSFVYSLKQLG